MITCITLLYAGIAFLVFKVFHVKPTAYPVATTAALGVVIVGAIVMFWTLASPLTPRVVVTRYVVQITPYVKGQVVSLHAKPNVPLKKGDVLFEIDRTPYQYTVDQTSAQLQAAESNVTQLEAGNRVAEANVAKAKADVAAMKAAFDVAVAIDEQNPLAISKLKLVQAREQYTAAQATLTEAKAAVDQSHAALAAGRDAVLTVEAQLKSAEFDLQQCTVTAPSDGFITDWQIREGTWVTDIKFASAGTFIDTSETYVVASFLAQELLNVKPGQPVEMAFSSNPGRMFNGAVDSVIEATGEGQFAPSGQLPSAAAIGSHGMLVAKIRFDSAEEAAKVPLGAAGAVTIYTDWGKPFHCISKVTIRIKKWLYFLPLPS